MGASPTWWGLYVPTEERPTTMTNQTKICPQCKSQIDARAKKCPRCASDLRGFFRKHPLLTLGLICFGLFIIIASAASHTSTPIRSTAPVQSDPKIAKIVTLSSNDNTPIALAVSEEAMDKVIQAGLDKNSQEQLRLLQDKQVVFVKSGARVKILEISNNLGGTKTKVQILDGQFKERIGWVISSQIVQQ